MCIRDRVNLGERGLIYPVSIALENETIQNNYSKHLQQITTSKQDNMTYGVFFRLIPSSLIWDDVEKYKKIGSPEFESFEDMVTFTMENTNKNMQFLKEKVHNNDIILIKCSNSTKINKFAKILLKQVSI